MKRKKLISAVAAIAIAASGAVAVPPPHLANAQATEVTGLDRWKPTLNIPDVYAGTPVSARDYLFFDDLTTPEVEAHNADYVESLEFVRIWVDNDINNAPAGTREVSVSVTFNIGSTTLKQTVNVKESAASRSSLELVDIETGDSISEYKYFEPNEKITARLTSCATSPRDCSADIPEAAGATIEFIDKTTSGWDASYDPATQIFTVQRTGLNRGKDWSPYLSGFRFVVTYKDGSTATWASAFKWTQEGDYLYIDHRDESFAPGETKTFPAPVLTDIDGNVVELPEGATYYVDVWGEGEDVDPAVDWSYSFDAATGSVSITAPATVTDNDSFTVSRGVTFADGSTVEGSIDSILQTMAMQEENAESAGDAAPVYTDTAARIDNPTATFQLGDTAATSFSLERAGDWEGEIVESGDIQTISSSDGQTTWTLNTVTGELSVDASALAKEVAESENPGEFKGLEFSRDITLTYEDGSQRSVSPTVFVYGMKGAFANNVSFSGLSDIRPGESYEVTPTVENFSYEYEELFEPNSPFYVDSYSDEKFLNGATWGTAEIVEGLGGDRESSVALEGFTVAGPNADGRFTVTAADDVAAQNPEIAEGGWVTVYIPITFDDGSTGEKAFAFRFIPTQRATNELWEYADRFTTRPGGQLTITPTKVWNQDNAPAITSASVTSDTLSADELSVAPDGTITVTTSQAGEHTISVTYATDTAAESTETISVLVDGEPVTTNFSYGDSIINVVPKIQDGAPSIFPEAAEPALGDALSIDSSTLPEGWVTLDANSGELTLNLPEDYSDYLDETQTVVVNVQFPGQPPRKESVKFVLRETIFGFPTETTITAGGTPEYLSRSFNLSDELAPILDTADLPAGLSVTTAQSELVVEADSTVPAGTYVLKLLPMSPEDFGGPLPPELIDEVAITVNAAAQTPDPTPDPEPQPQPEFQEVPAKDVVSGTSVDVTPQITNQAAGSEVTAEANVAGVTLTQVDGKWTANIPAEVQGQVIVTFKLFMDGKLVDELQITMNVTRPESGLKVVSAPSGGGSGAYPMDYNDAVYTNAELRLIPDKTDIAAELISIEQDTKTVNINLPGTYPAGVYAVTVGMFQNNVEVDRKTINVVVGERAAFVTDTATVGDGAAEYVPVLTGALEGATVVLGDNNLPAGAVSVQDGTVVFGDIPAGTYNLELLLEDANGELLGTQTVTYTVPQAPNPQPSGDDSSSTGEKIGLGVGITAAVAATIAGVLFALLRLNIPGLAPVRAQILAALPPQLRNLL